jgi:hypothetical protein
MATAKDSDPIQITTVDKEDRLVKQEIKQEPEPDCCYQPSTLMCLVKDEEELDSK